MNVLCIVAHPDDETLGCGATLARHAAAGDSVSVLTYTDGVGSRFTETRDKSTAVLERRIAFDRAMEALGIVGAHRREDFADQGLDAVPIRDLARAAALWIEGFKADVVYTHWPGDLNADHRAVVEAVLVATRPAVSRVRAVYACEIPSASEWNFGGQAFAPTVFVEIHPTTFDRKVRALACYGSEIPCEKHPRAIPSVLALATWRGATVGAYLAEAFQVLRARVTMYSEVRM